MSRLVQPPEVMTEVLLSPEKLLSAANFLADTAKMEPAIAPAAAEPPEPAAAELPEMDSSVGMAATKAKKGAALGALQQAQVPVKQKGDNYLSRVAKYIPAEILAAYIAALGLIKTSDEPNLRWWLYLAFLVLCFVMTPIYFNLLADEGEPKKMQMVVSSVAFLVWAYSLGGFFDEIKLYHSLVASLILIAFTLISGAFFPRPVAAGK